MNRLLSRLKALWDLSDKLVKETKKNRWAFIEKIMNEANQAKIVEPSLLDELENNEQI